MKYAAICAALLLSVASVSYAAMDADTENFLKTTYAKNLGEVEMGKMAVQKTQNADVKKFGQHLVDDHTKANEDLKMLTAKFEMTMPAEGTKEQMAMRDRLMKMDGAAFDRAFVTGMIDSHTKNIDVFNNYVTNGKVAEVKDWATKMLPTLKHHLEMARDLDTRLTKGANASSAEMDARTMDVSYQRDAAEMERSRVDTSVGADVGLERSDRFERADRFDRGDRFENRGDRVGVYERSDYVSYDAAMGCEGCHEDCDSVRTHTPRRGENLDDVVYDNDWNATFTDTINTNYGNY
jgi:putative membrane protein